MWLSEATTAGAAVPTSPLFAAPLRQTYCVSPGQCQAGDRNPGNKLRGLPAQRSPTTGSLS